MRLSKSEEAVMEIIWKNEKVFFKDLLESYPEPKPAATTVATLLKRMQDKGFVGYEVFGNSRQYYPLVSKTDYFSNHVRGMIRTSFDDSALQFASFFTATAKLSTAELEHLKKIIDKQIKKRKK